MRHPVLADLDLLNMFKAEGSYYFTFFYEERKGQIPTFLQKTQAELEGALGDYCSKIVVGPRRTEIYFQNNTPLADMFIFREKLNALVKY